MKILVIGNGFDIEHGLPTLYKDFMDFMKGISILKKNTDKVFTEEKFSFELENELPHKVDKNVKNYFYNRSLINFSLFNKWSEEENSKELIECADKNIWINYFLERICDENQGWIDFECEISNVIKSLEYMIKFRIKREVEKDIHCDQKKIKIETNIFSLIKRYLLSNETNVDIRTRIQKEKISEFSKYEYNNKIIKILNNHLNSLIKCLELYLEECVGKIDVKYVSPDIKDIKFDKVLSFNYTNTYEIIHGFNNNDIEYHYIHGKADITRDISDNNMVLGIDEYLDDDAKSKELEFIAFKKYFQRIYKKTGNKYKKWIKDINKRYKEITSQAIFNIKEINSIIIENQLKDNRNEIFIFGHSLDVTDKEILEELIKCKNTVTTIFISIKMRMLNKLLI